MAIPDFQSCMLPMLQLARDGEVHSLAEAREVIAVHFGLTDEERAERVPSGRQQRFDNRVSWAKVYLVQAGALTSPRKAHFQITDRGRQLLTEEHQRIDLTLLKRFPEFNEFRGSSRTGGGRITPPPGVETPEEILDQAHQHIRAALARDVLDRVKAASPAFFEQLVVELLLAMGYGSSFAEAGKAIGRSGDEGIDGVISEDRLGLDAIFIQAKRWDGTVGRPDVQKFVGALHGKRARKGVFITTGTFSAEAADYVSHIDPRVVLINGQQLAEYMIDFNLGVTTRAIYELKRIDSDYFGEE